MNIDDISLRMGVYGEGFILDLEDDIRDFMKVMNLIKFNERDCDEILFQIIDSMERVSANEMYNVFAKLPDPNLLTNLSYLEDEFFERKLKEVILKTGLAIHNALFNLGLLDDQFFNEDGARFVYKKLVGGCPLIMLLPEGNPNVGHF